MTIITNKYRTHNTDFFVQDIVDSNYYIFVSSTEISQSLNSEYSINDFLEKTLFGKKISAPDVFYLADNNRWRYGTVYDQYDDAVDLSTKTFYTVVYPSDNSTGDYRVFKCLFNNYGQPSYNAPNYENDVADQIYRLGDGYVWKYMYAISVIEFQKYSVLSYIPIIGTSSATPVVGKSIDHIDVTNYDTNKGYEVKSGTIKEVLDNDIVISGTGLSGVPNYYSGQTFSVLNTSTNTTEIYTIDQYSFDSTEFKATITLFDKDSFIEPNFTFEIFPRIEITGDGTGAIATPNINNTLGTIEKITIKNKGSGYTNATARVITPAYGFDTIAANSIDVEAILRPVLSPSSGHATDFKNELKSKRVIIYTTFSDTENLSIPSSNQYTKIGLVKNPDFVSNTTPSLFDNRIQLELNTSILFEDEIVTQVDGSVITFSAQVHEASGNTVYLCNYHGPYQNHDNDGYFDIPLDPSKSIVSSQNQFISINNITRPTYVQKTGEVYYMTSFPPITRTASSNEEYKIVLEF